MSSSAAWGNGFQGYTAADKGRPGPRFLKIPDRSVNISPKPGNTLSTIRCKYKESEKKEVRSVRNFDDQTWRYLLCGFKPGGGLGTRRNPSGIGDTKRRRQPAQPDGDLCGDHVQDE